MVNQMMKSTCWKCGRQVEAERPRGNLGEVFTLLSEREVRVLCNECEPKSGWSPVKEKEEKGDA